MLHPSCPGLPHVKGTVFVQKLWITPLRNRSFYCIIHNRNCVQNNLFLIFTGISRSYVPSERKVDVP